MESRFEYMCVGYEDRKGPWDGKGDILQDGEGEAANTMTRKQRTGPDTGGTTGLAGKGKVKVKGEGNGGRVWQ